MASAQKPQNVKPKNVVIEAADKGGAVIVWRTNLYKQEAFRQLSHAKFYSKIPVDHTLQNQKIVKKNQQTYFGRKIA